MKLATARKLVEKLQEDGYEAYVYGADPNYPEDMDDLSEPNYSGRGMFGKCTYGVVTDATGVGRKGQFRSDNMGKDYIYY